MKAPRRLLLAVLPAALLLASGAGLAYQLSYTNSGKVVKWAAAYALEFTEPSTLSNATGPGQAFRAALGTWNKVPGSAFRFQVLDGSHVPHNLLPVSDGYNDVQLIDLSLGSGVLAVTYWGDWDESTGFWKDTDMDFTTAESYDFESVALHEQGHVLGLDHTGNSTSVMYPYIPPIHRNLETDDMNGVRALYPASSGGGGGTIPSQPPGLPVLGGVLLSLGLSDTEVEAGDAVDVSCSIIHSQAQPLFLQAMYTVPATYGLFPEISVPAGTPYSLTRNFTVSEVPGTYSLSATLLGSDGTYNYRASGQGAATVVVARQPIPLPLQDRLNASLGPTGQDRVEVLLGRGTRFLLELQRDEDSGMTPGLAVIDPSERNLSWKPGRILRARAAGVHVLRVTNTSANRGSYRLFTEARGPAKALPARGTVSGAATAEAVVTLFARTAGVLSVKGPRKLDLRIVGLRSPSGAEVGVTPGASVALDEIAEDGAWTVLVRSGTGGTGKFKVAFAGEWVLGEELTR